METVDLVQSIAIIVLVVSAVALSLALTMVIIGVFPRVLRIAANLEETTESAAQTATNVAAISRSIAERSDKMAENLAAAVSNLNVMTASTAEVARNAAVISRSLAERSDEIAENVAATAENLKTATASTAEAARNLASASKVLRLVGIVANLIPTSRGQLLAIVKDAKAAIGREDTARIINNPLVRGVRRVMRVFRSRNQ